ncbi:MAG: GHMP kinase [Planctomycetes bacterium]|nr:GHMP kinase [Planctomycetota bacterium]
MAICWALVLGAWSFPLRRGITICPTLPGVSAKSPCVHAPCLLQSRASNLPLKPGFTPGHRSVTENPSSFTLSAPGRICIFGEHQDYLGLSVVAMAIDLRMTIMATPRSDNVYHLDMPDIRHVEHFVPREALPYRHQRDYVRSVIAVLKRRGLSFDRGHDFKITSRIPMNAGVSSSSAFVILWAAACLQAHGQLSSISGEGIAQIGHAAEVLEFKEPGGMMDHYTCTLGGLLYIDCADPIRPTPISPRLDGFVLGNSLEKKDTKAVLRKAKEATLRGVEALTAVLPGFTLKSTPMDQAVPHLRKLPDQSSRMVYANLVNRDLCQKARVLFEEGVYDQDVLGEMLDNHHEMLRDHLGISTEKIERMIDAAKSAGALGCKINGSGGGGTMIAYAPDHQKPVAAAIQKAGGKAYIIKKAEGLRLEAGLLE